MARNITSKAGNSSKPAMPSGKRVQASKPTIKSGGTTVKLGKNKAAYEGNKGPHGYR